MFCPECGKKNDNESKFCVYCGTAFPEYHNEPEAHYDSSFHGAYKVAKHKS